MFCSEKVQKKGTFAFFLDSWILHGLGSWILHGGAVQGAMLQDEDAAVDAYNFTVGESPLQLFQGLGIFVGLMVGGNKHSPVDDEEVGVGGRQPLPVFVMAWVWEWEREELVGLPVGGAESQQFSLHCSQFVVVLIGGVVTFYVGD